jgi:hypothetical protein
VHERRKEVQVRIDQPRQHGRSSTVDALGPGTDTVAQGSARGAELEDPSRPHRDRAGGRPVAERPDAGVLEEPVGAGQSEEGSGFASFTFISWPQHVTVPVLPLLQRISVPHVAHR